MARRETWIVGLVVLTTVVGCREQPKTKPPNALPVKIEAVVSEETPVEAVVVEEPAETEGAIEATESPKPERVLFLTPGGPLMADIYLSIDGRPHDEPLQEQIQKVLDAADTDGDGRATWQEWKENEEFFEEELVEESNYSVRKVKDWIKKYDENSDKKMQPDEAAGWLGRNGNGSARAFSVRSSKSYASRLSSSSRIWQLLDHDHDGVLSEAEIQSASERFWLLDANDDRMITLTELASLEEQLEMAGASAFRANFVLNRYAAIHLDSSLEVDSLDSLLCDLYAPRQNLSSQSFPGLPELFATLDYDRSGWLDLEELSELFRMEPMLEITVDFHEAEESPGSATVRVEGLADELALLSQQAEDRVVISFGKTRLLISAHDLSAGEGDVVALQQSQLRLMVHDESDAVFRELDSDGDGRFGERELETCAERLLQYDANNDKQLTDDELPYSMIVAFMRGEAANQRSFYVPDVTSGMDVGEKTPIWFTQADFNGDGDLSRREFLGSSEKFSKLDLNQDGYIDRDEAAKYSAK